jgi:ubiquinone/menaquinone biosynthesis C-methylase UbiE
LTRENVALDLGTGWGPVATGLAQHCSAVVATDMFLPRLEFLALRCLQENIQNVHLAQANALTLPFEDAQFDLVSMIGVFEWIGVDSSLGITPEESQERCLMECHRVLKAGREIVIGIENRIGMKYLLGQPDDHTQITNITFLNRTEANLRSRQLRNENFDIRTHTMQDYHAILQAAGFSHIRFFAAFPSYQLWEAIVPLNAPEPLHFFLNHLQADEREETDNQRMIQVLRHLSTHGHAAEYVNSFFIVARK